LGRRPKNISVGFCIGGSIDFEPILHFTHLSQGRSVLFISFKKVGVEYVNACIKELFVMY